MWKLFSYSNKKHPCNFVYYQSLLSFNKLQEPKWMFFIRIWKLFIMSLWSLMYKSINQLKSAYHSTLILSLLLWKYLKFRVYRQFAHTNCSFLSIKSMTFNLLLRSNSYFVGIIPFLQRIYAKINNWLAAYCSQISFEPFQKVPK